MYSERCTCSIKYWEKDKAGKAGRRKRLVELAE
jgi:hypothetical protein